MAQSNYLHLSHKVSYLVCHFWSTVGNNPNEIVIHDYVKSQGTQDTYRQMYMKV